MRTGSVGNRSADDMVRTLTEPKKTTIISARTKLLERGYLEEVEYDAINIEPVLIYSKSDVRVVFLRHKWETIAQIPFQKNEKGGVTSQAEKYGKFLAVDVDGNSILQFKLPENEKDALEILEEFD